MKIATIKFLFLFFILQLQTGTAQNVTFEEVPTFFPRLEGLGFGIMDCGYLHVPESWDNPDGEKIKIAATILRSYSDKKEVDAVVFMQGGPGASGIRTLGYWLTHPLRNSSDIVLFDVRGTGRSKPRLCPDLGNKFLETLAKNQSEEKDEEEKSNDALLCRQDLINRNIDVTAYNSISVSKDLHALKEHLEYKHWNVYGVSYGTYMAQVYAANYPEDIQRLILDSSIDDISTYYVKNTSNYMGSLERVFELCKKDPEANTQYPDLEKVYYEVIKEFEDNPLTVSVEKSVISTGEFTYNTEDFKVAIQQALYSEELVDLIPLLIYQFKNRNKEALGNLVSAFSALLAMDYGLYYCVTCNEVIHNNEYTSYEKNVSKYPLLSGGVSFYKSDFKVCEAWNKNLTDSLQTITNLDTLSKATYPVLIFSGEYDPITPRENGKKTLDKFQNGTLLLADAYGHTPSFNAVGNKMIENFINNKTEEINSEAFTKVRTTNLVKNIEINKGVSKMGNSINEMNPLFLLPLVIALGTMLVFLLIFLVKLIKRRYALLSDRIIRFIIAITSIVGLVVLGGLISALLAVSEQNLYILAFGLPENYSYIFVLSFVFLGLLVATLLYYFITLRKTKDRSILFSVLFSNMVLLSYLLYWGILSF